MGHSSSSNTYRVFKKINECIEQSIHVISYEDANLNKIESNNEYELNKLLEVQKSEGSKANADQGSSKKTKENDESDE